MVGRNFRYALPVTVSDNNLKNLITEITDGVASWKILKDHFEPVTRARVIQLLDQFFGTKYQPGEDVGIFISRVKTAATRLQEAGHKLDDLYIGFQLIRWLPQEFQSTVQQIYRWKEEDFRVVKIEAELILEANRLQLMKQDLEKAENAYLSSFTSKKSKTLPGATAAAHGDPNGKNDYQKKGGKVFNCKTIKNVKQSIKTIGPCYVCNKYGHLKVNSKEKKSLQKSPSTVNESFNTGQKVNSNLGYNLNLPDYYDDEDDSDRVKDSLTSRLVSKTSTETPSTSEKPDVSSDNHSLIPCTEVKWIRNIGRKVTGSNVYYSIEGEATRLKSFNEIERYCDKIRDASKWRDAMDKEINVMMERKDWDLVDHPDNIKILENRWVYTIKYDENNKIVRYNARLVARGNTQLRGESFDEVFSPVINFTIVRLFFTICVCLWKWTHIQVDITNAYLYANLDTVIYMKQPTGYEIDNNKVCKLRKAIYGLHQSGRQWFWN
ncbi:retrovirus-related Pol polyprotein from transposon RE1 [Trichonephila clavipes]|nr:retrovirus-related Pol polyprotein from transposon RE1 [Trichonephila clavipes]